MGLRRLSLAFLLAGFLNGQELPSGVHRVGNGVSAPRLTVRAEPLYTEPARRTGLEGTVILSAIINANGVPENIQIVKRLGLGLDQKALDAISQWKFEPGTKDGQPVAVFAQIEVSFHLMGTTATTEKVQREAADGVIASQVHLGNMLMAGRALAADPVQAIQWFKTAADKGSGDAEAMMGFAYWQGKGVTRDLVQAYYWLGRAAQSGAEGAADDLAALSKALSPEQFSQAQALVGNVRKP